MVESGGWDELNERRGGRFRALCEAHRLVAWESAMQDVTPVGSTIGGILIGLSASIMLLLDGKIVGISGVFAGVLRPARRGPISTAAIERRCLTIGTRFT